MATARTPAPSPPPEPPKEEPSGGKTWQQERFEQSYPNAAAPDSGQESPPPAPEEGTPS